MKISNETLSILKSFSMINKSIAVDPGSELRTVTAPHSTVMAAAKVSETFEQPFEIYDLNQFLSVASLFDNPDYEFGTNSVVISNSNSSVEYGYGGRANVKTPPSKNIPIEDTLVSFELPNNLLRRTIEAAKILGLSHWSVIGDGETVSIVVNHQDKITENTFRTVVSSSNDQEFQMNFPIESFRFMPEDYVMTITPEGIARLSANDGALQYFIVVSSN